MNIQGKGKGTAHNHVVKLRAVPRQYGTLISIFKGAPVARSENCEKLGQAHGETHKDMFIFTKHINGASGGK